MELLLFAGAVALALFVETLYLRRIIMTTTQQLLDAISGVNSQLAKAKIEILAKIEELETQIGNGEIDGEAILAALAGVKAAAQGLDDIVPRPDQTGPNASGS